MRQGYDRGDVTGTWLVSSLLAIIGLAAAVPDPVPFKTLAGGTQSGIEDAKTVVVRTSAEWKTLCTEHGQPCPPVDFSRSTVVGVFLGTRPTAGFSAEITRIDRDGDALVVTWREKQPGPGEMAAQMMTMPFQLATVDRVTGPVRFTRLR